MMVILIPPKVMNTGVMLYIINRSEFDSEELFIDSPSESNSNFFSESDDRLWQHWLKR